MRGKKRHRKKAAKKAAEKFKRARAATLARYFDAALGNLPEGAKIVLFQGPHHDGDLMRELLEYRTPPELDPHHAAWIAWATGQ